MGIHSCSVDSACSSSDANTAAAAAAVCFSSLVLVAAVLKVAVASDSDTVLNGICSPSLLEVCKSGMSSVYAHAAAGTANSAAHLH